MIIKSDRTEFEINKADMIESSYVNLMTQAFI